MIYIIAEADATCATDVVVFDLIIYVHSIILYHYIVILLLLLLQLLLYNNNYSSSASKQNAAKEEEAAQDEYDEYQEVHTLQLTGKRLESYKREYEQLFFSMNGAAIFFRRTDVDT